MVDKIMCLSLTTPGASTGSIPTHNSGPRLSPVVGNVSTMFSFFSFAFPVLDHRSGNGLAFFWSTRPFNSPMRSSAILFVLSFGFPLFFPPAGQPWPLPIGFVTCHLDTRCFLLFRSRRTLYYFYPFLRYSHIVDARNSCIPSLSHAREA